MKNKSLIDTKINVLYLSRDGLMEPLGRSQILSYLIPLASDYKFQIVSFEKQFDLNDQNKIDELKNICLANDICWHPLKYSTINRKLGILIGFFTMFFKVISLRKEIDFIHCRSYYTSFVVLFFKVFQKTDFIFDMRALWPEELVQSKRLKHNSISWYVIKKLEYYCLKNSLQVVSLTRSALIHLNQIYPELNLLNKSIVIPTCSDLNHFYLNKSKKDEIIISCVGTILSGWFKTDIFVVVVNYFLSNYPNVKIEIVSRDDESKILNLFKNNKPNKRLTIRSAQYNEMPAILSRHSGSLFFFNSNISKLGSAPTRMGELLSSGIPILTNSGVGDVGEIVKKHKVGVIINKLDSKSIYNACDKFYTLLQKKEINSHCREIAEKLLSLEQGVKSYQHVYSKFIK